MWSISFALVVVQILCLLKLGFALCNSFQMAVQIHHFYFISSGVQPVRQLYYPYPVWV